MFGILFFIQVYPSFDHREGEMQIGGKKDERGPERYSFLGKKRIRNE